MFFILLNLFISVCFKTSSTLFIALGGYHSCALKRNETKCWGKGTWNQLGYGDTIHRGDEANEMGENLLEIDLGSSIPTQIVTGDVHTCVLSITNEVKCFGENYYGQLGYGDIVDLGSNFTPIQITAGKYHNCAISKAKKVKCWGANNGGQLGIGDKNHRGAEPNEMGDNLPEVDLGASFVPMQIEAGSLHTCALSINHTVKCFGKNTYGQLGYGDTIDRGSGTNDMGDNLPGLDLGASFLPMQITAGEHYNCALSTTNRAKCFGVNSYGQLGYGDKNSRGDAATEMGDNLPDIHLGSQFIPTQMSAGATHTCALSTAHEVKCFGFNGYGQLGYGDTNNRGEASNEMNDSLLEIDLGSGFIPTQIIAGSQHTCALSSTNEVKCFGKNTYGQLGYGDINNRGDGADEMGDNLPDIDLGSFTPEPTAVPTQPTSVPSDVSTAPTVDPTTLPTAAPTDPSVYPTHAPTTDPTEPTRDPSIYPTLVPRTSDPTYPTMKLMDGEVVEAFQSSITPPNTTVNTHESTDIVPTALLCIALVSVVLAIFVLGRRYLKQKMKVISDARHMAENSVRSSDIHHVAMNTAGMMSDIHHRAANSVNASDIHHRAMNTTDDIYNVEMGYTCEGPSDQCEDKKKTESDYDDDALYKQCNDCGKHDFGKVYDGDALFYCNQCCMNHGSTKKKSLWNNEVQLVNMMYSTPNPGVLSNEVRKGEEVQKWLETDVHLAQYFDVLIKNGYESMDIVQDISNWRELQEIGIESKQHQMIIMEEILKWKNKHTTEMQSVMTTGNDAGNSEGNNNKEGGNDEFQEADITTGGEGITTIT